MRLSNDFDRFCAAVAAGQKPPVPALYLGQRDLGHIVAVAERIHRLRVSCNTEQEKISPFGEIFSSTFVVLVWVRHAYGQCYRS